MISWVMHYVFRGYAHLRDDKISQFICVMLVSLVGAVVLPKPLNTIAVFTFGVLWMLVHITACVIHRYRTDQDAIGAALMTQLRARAHPRDYKGIYVWDMEEIANDPDL